MDLLPLLVFYKPDSIANILELVDVISQLIVTIDTNNKTVMFIHTGPNSILNFYQFCKGFYYFDTSNSNAFNTVINA